MRLLRNYWLDENTYIFKNYKDALLGGVVLLVLPVFSLVSTFSVEQVAGNNFLFPIVSMSLAGAYDTYGRYKANSPRNFKLAFRLFLDMLAIFFSALAYKLDSSWLRFVAPSILVICGGTLLIEIFIRVDLAVKLSPWYF